jgi:general secretion pathway protein K
MQRQQQQMSGLNQVPSVLTGSSTLQLQNGTAEVEVIDETGKINLNAPLDQTFVDLVYNLLIMVGLDPEQADIITDSIMDWRDPDDFVSPSGAESDYYLSLENPYLPKNGFFDAPDELLLISGVTPEIYYGRKGLTEAGERMEYYGLQKYFTTFTRSQAINVNSAPLPVLAAIPYLDYQSATEIFNLRQEGPIMDTADLMNRIPGLPTDVARLLSPQATNSVYTLVSDGKLNGSEVVSRIRCVVRIDGAGAKGYSILYWNEANTEI